MRRARWIGLGVWLIAGAARADCAPASLDESAAGFAAALVPALAPFGVKAALPAGAPTGDRAPYMLPFIHVSLFLTERAGALREVDAVISAPSDSRDVAALLALASFTLARYSNQTEAALAPGVVADAEAHKAPGSWVESSGDARAVFTRGPTALVVKIGRASCQDP